MKYSPQIDGLRAVAILPVVLFHLQGKLAPGGFVGVDVFFVISGYLITGTILSDFEERGFSILEFYRRRIRRIFPALFAMMAAVLVAGFLFYLPFSYKQVGQSAAAAALFVSNLYFWYRSGYFDVSARDAPLLHTWSLSVEEQFYVLYPLLLALCYPRSRRLCVALVLLLALCSFTASVTLLPTQPGGAFFWAPPRAWELFAGALIQFGCLPRLESRLLREAILSGGLALIAAAIVCLSHNTPFPGYAALLPVVGAGMVIHAARGGPSLAGRLLATAPLRFTGLISYSLYLWHWPVIVFFRYRHIDRLTSGDVALAGLASFALAVLSWRYVETPFRLRLTAMKRSHVLAAGGIAIMATLAAGAVLQLTGGAAFRVPARVLYLDAFHQSISPYGEHCSNSPSQYVSPQEACAFNPGKPRQFALWGDSHAEAATPAFVDAAKEQGVTMHYFGRPGCPPIPNLGRTPGSAGRPDPCLRFNAETFEYLEQSPAIREVFLVARWEWFIRGYPTELGPADPEDDVQVFAPDGHLLGIPERMERMRAGLQSVAEAFAKAGKTLVLVYPIPEVGYDVPGTLAKLAMYGGNGTGLHPSFSAYQARERDAFGVLDSIRGGNVRRIYPHLRFCDAQSCAASKDGDPLYYDSNHISLPGNRLLQPLIRQELMASGANK